MKSFEKFVFEERLKDGVNTFSYTVWLAHYTS